jgi:hypothetical protein
MIKYFHMEQGGGKLTEITEGEYEFRFKKHTSEESFAKMLDRMPEPGYGFETYYGTCFAVEVEDAS